MRSLYKANSGCAWIPFVGVGVLAAFIPIVGLVVSPVLLLGAFIVLIAPVRGTMLLDYVVDHQQYKANLLLANRMSENTYSDVSCPRCAHLFASTKKNTVYAWPDGESHPIQCPGCGQTVYRVRNSVLWVPHPAVTLSGNLEEYM